MMLKDSAYNEIKAKILSCEYAPRSLLSEEMICSDLNVSRTPVRDAISRLSHENLVHVVPKKGIFVQDISIKDLSAIYEARLLVEPHIILNHGAKAKKEHLEELLIKFQGIDMATMKSLDYTIIDTQFHNAIFFIAGNIYYNQMYESLSNQNFRISVLGGHSSLERREQSRIEHIDILQNMLAEEYQLAAQAMEQHILRAKQNKFELLLQNETFSNLIGI